VKDDELKLRNACDCYRNLNHHSDVIKNNLTSTFICDRLLVAEVGESRVAFNVVLLGDLLVVYLDKVDTKMIRLVIDRFQFLEHLVALPAVPPVCRSTKFLVLIID